MDEKVEPQSEAADMTERVEEMLSAIDAACTELDKHADSGGGVSIEDLLEVSDQMKETAQEAESATVAEEPTVAGDQPASEQEATQAKPQVTDVTSEAEGDQAEAPDVGAAATDESGAFDIESLVEEVSQAVGEEDDLAEQLAAVTEALKEAAPEDNLDASTQEAQDADFVGDAIATDEPAPEATSGDDLSEASAPPAIPESVLTSAPASIGALDAELASLADAMIDGSFEDANGEESEFRAVETEAMAAEREPAGTAVEPELADDEFFSVPGDTLPGTQARDSSPPPSTESLATDEVAQAEIVETTGSAEHPGQAGESAPASPEPDRGVASPAAVAVRPASPKGRLAGLAGVSTRVAQLSRPAAQKAWIAARPPLSRALLTVSKPAEKLSPTMRDTIGWMAIYTVFLAVCVWGFVLLFRKPAAPVPTANPIGVLGEPSHPEPES